MIEGHPWIWVLPLLCLGLTCSTVWPLENTWVYHCTMALTTLKRGEKLASVHSRACWRGPKRLSSFWIMLGDLLGVSTSRPIFGRWHFEIFPAQKVRDMFVNCVNHAVFSCQFAGVCRCLNTSSEQIRLNFLIFPDKKRRTTWFFTAEVVAKTYKSYYDLQVRRWDGNCMASCDRDGGCFLSLGTCCTLR